MAYEKFRSRSKQRDYYDDDRSDNRRARNPKKKTGCTMGDSYSKKTGAQVHWIRGWNASKSKGLLSFVATEAKENSRGVSKSDRQWVRLVAKVTSSRNAEPFLTSCFWYKDTQKLVFPDLKMVASPKTNYWGRAYKPKN